MASNNDNNTIFGDRIDNPLNKIDSLGTFIQGFDPTSFGVELDPFEAGFAFIYWVSLPSWFEKDYKLKYFKSYTQKFVTSFQGVTDINLDEASVQYGFAGNNVSFASGIQKGNTDFSMGFKEFSGTPLTQMIERWITLIRDPNTGIALYPKLYDCELSARNHSGQLLYIVVRPDATNTKHGNVEKAILYTNVWPMNIPYGSLFGYSQGSQDVVPTVEINFKGVPIMGDAVTKYAKKILEEEILDVSENNANNPGLFIDTNTQAGDENTELLTSTVFKDVFNGEE